MRIKEYALLENQKSCGMRSYHSVLSPRKRPYNAHHHTECELSLFIKGAGVYTVGKKKYNFSAGDVFLFGSNEEHCISEITKEIDLLNLQFEPYILWESPNSADLLTIFNARNGLFENQLRDERGELAEHILKVENELSSKQACYALNAKCCLFMALTALIRKYPYFNYDGSAKATDGITQALRIALDYIDENLTNKLTLGNIAAAACLSPNYFSYVFKKYNGITLWDYINIKRVEKAIKALKSERNTKIEIAESCGFSSSSNFYKIFADITGKKPNDYIEKNSTRSSKKS